ncbi:putative 1-aminocyclopropane-1-carboxylate oxidase [Talaromyces proteolyticus]|uniref:1-aminocyclopropane-1-carboxylate oxidase n=1 Tax=Talaromyces proteolyticus TaxID=1131652 RepID=A0AAD4L3Z7_9EURO|nr:putative 1-aminocyclopropane-1-carboxylate oxidase [Talaromyces proteolyticus]KAH8705473.1 putative 1-aminocyclopropane-1-carboxylate oxidase [Talaromyces proteolyticus]
MELENFPGLPPFPGNMLVMDLDRLSLAKLLDHDDEECRRFYLACEKIGFFYLDMRSQKDGQSILSYADKLFRVSEQLFSLKVEEKGKYDFSEKNSFFGYKPLGSYVIDSRGNTDREEFYDVSRDDLLGHAHALPQPEVVNEELEVFKSFASSTHSVIVTPLLDLLNEHLQLPPSTLANLHRIDRPSGDMVRLTRCPPQPVEDKAARLGEHTDFGSITVLFNRLGGLQVLVPGTDAQWKWIKPIPGHCIVNLGDTLVKFTNGLLRSNIHRVVASPGEQAECIRYSLGYFSRPDHNAVLKRLDSPAIPALPAGIVEEDFTTRDWLVRRALSRRVNLRNGVSSSALDYAKHSGTEKISRRVKA